VLNLSTAIRRPGRSTAGVRGWSTVAGCRSTLTVAPFASQTQITTVSLHCRGRSIATLPHLSTPESFAQSSATGSKNALADGQLVLLKEGFDRFDNCGNGLLTEEELGSAMVSVLGERPAKVKLQGIVQEVSTGSKDGQDAIGYTEYLDIMADRIHNPDWSQQHWEEEYINKPAPLKTRLLAEFYDYLSTMVVGLAAIIAGPAQGLVVNAFYTFKDLFADSGTRSIGAKYRSLEIVKVEDGAPTSKVATTSNIVMRSAYLPIPFFCDAFFCDGKLTFTSIVVLVNLGLILLSPQRRTIGDMLAGTMLVPQLPNHKLRLQLSKRSLD
jgi:uncharacterized RDD family membrane protein YckC